MTPIENPELSAVLRGIAATLDESRRQPPPVEVFGRLLTQLGPSASEAVTPSSPLEAFSNQVDALGDLLRSITPSDWDSAAAPYAWSTHGLVAHLLVIERYTAHVLGVATDAVPQDAEAPHLLMGASLIEAELAREPAATADEWYRCARSTAGSVTTFGDNPRSRVYQFHGWPFSLSALLLARAFELWTHADDIRRATGRQIMAPSPSDLRVMSTMSVGSVEALLPVVRPDSVAPTTRVVLTGSGGGTFDLVGADPQRRLTVVLDVVDYCRLADAAN